MKCLQPQSEAIVSIPIVIGVSQRAVNAKKDSRGGDDRACEDEWNRKSETKVRGAVGGVRMNMTVGM